MTNPTTPTVPAKCPACLCAEFRDYIAAPGPQTKNRFFNCGSIYGVDSADWTSVCRAGWDYAIQARAELEKANARGDEYRNNFEYVTKSRREAIIEVETIRAELAGFGRDSQPAHLLVRALREIYRLACECVDTNSSYSFIRLARDIKGFREWEGKEKTARGFYTVTPSGHEAHITGDPHIDSKTLGALHQMIDLASKQFEGGQAGEVARPVIVTAGESVYLCPNCGNWRSVEDHHTVTKCAFCGDDEIDLAESADVP